LLDRSPLAGRVALHLELPAAEQGVAVFMSTAPMDPDRSYSFLVGPSGLEYLSNLRLPKEIKTSKIPLPAEVEAGSKIVHYSLFYDLSANRQTIIGNGHRLGEFPIFPQSSGGFRGLAVPLVKAPLPSDPSESAILNVLPPPGSRQPATKLLRARSA